MNFSDDDKHAATLALLSEALDFLKRMPPVPVTYHFCKKIEAHLAEPTQVLVQKVTASGIVLTGSTYSPNGTPLLQARLNMPASLLVWSPKPGPVAAYKAASQHIIRGIYGGGIKIGLRLETQRSVKMIPEV